jgi:hypothetical protein
MKRLTSRDVEHADGTSPMFMQACDVLSRALDYLAHSWGIDTPRDQMVANLDARVILIHCKTQIIDEAELEMIVNNRVLYGKLERE